MNNDDWEFIEETLRDYFSVKKNELIQESRDYISERFTTFDNNRMDEIITDTINFDIDILLEQLGKPNPDKGGISNGHMPLSLLAPYRIVGPAFLGLGVLAIMLLNMFAG